MKNDTWTRSVRNRIARIASEMDSCAAIDGADMTKSERVYFKNKLLDFMREWDNKCDR